MSLINETLKNLHNQNNEDMILNPSSKKPQSSPSAKSYPNTIMIILITFGIILAVFYVTYNFQIGEYYNSTKNYFAKRSAWLVENTTSLKNKLTIVDKSVVEKSKSSSKQFSSAVQMQYYKAMSLLNEGKEEQAKQDLQLILDENPDFAPAKKAIGLLSSK